MFSWATKEYILEKMTWKQVIYYFNEGWKAKKTEARVHWGTYGALMNGESLEKPLKDKIRDPGEITLDIVKRYYPDAHYEQGKIVHS